MTTEDGTTTRPTVTESTTTEEIEGLRLDAVEDVSTIEAPVTVYPETLRSWLREAARTGEKIRAHAETGMYVPEPVLPAFKHVRLETPEDDEIDGFYEVTAEGGTRYDLLVGASAVEEVPEDALVTSVADLPEERRELATRAIERRQTARVYPETELGEWVRHEFFGGYYSYEGTTYLGMEVEQTDAAFFSTVAWYVLSLSPVGREEASNPLVLRFPEIDERVRRIIDQLLADRRDGQVSTALGTDASREAIAEFAGETDYLLAHTDVFAVTVEHRAGDT